MTHQPDAASMLDRQATLLVSCGRGLVPYLQAELAGLGHEARESRLADVEIRGSLLAAMRLNLHLRTAYRVLYELASFPCENPEMLYAGGRAMAWEEWLDPDGYVSVTAWVDHPTIRHTSFPVLRLKDAIVDRMQEACGRRPDSGPDRDRAVVHLYWAGSEARLYIDTSGQKLSDRGYRRLPRQAPLRENLAAGLIMASGYDGTQAFVSPMCGSGTLAIEAALIATGRPPGLLRGNFGFQHLRWHDERTWAAMRADARQGRSPDAPAPIIATDHDPEAIAAARKNAMTAGVENLIDFQVCAFADTPLPAGPGIVLINPPYGERLGEAGELAPAYKALGDWFKQRCRGYTCHVLTGSKPLAKAIGLRPSRRLEFWNGRIECRLLRYEIYAGSR